MTAVTCSICQKHAGEVEQPPGGYLYADEHWKVSHGPPEACAAGTLVLESARHFLDFADMTIREAASYGWMLRTLYIALREVTGAERIYATVLLEGAPHFHAWLVPRPAGVTERAAAFLARRRPCSPSEATDLADKLRAVVDELV